jgi:hypothetical protein
VLALRRKGDGRIGRRRLTDVPLEGVTVVEEFVFALGVVVVVVGPERLA